MSFLQGFAHDPSDNDDRRLAKITAFIVAGSCCLAGACWAVMYYAFFGPVLTTCLPAAFVLIVGLALIVSHYTRNHLWAVYAQIFCIIYITTAIQWSIGGVFDSGFVMVWAFIGPITALLFFSLRQAILWMLPFLFNIGITVAMDDYFSAHGLEVGADLQRLFFMMNLGVSTVVIFAFASYFMHNTLKERERADRLLLNILPASIARKLKSGESTIVQRYENVTVLFADIVGFTEFSASRPPEEVLRKLEGLFSRFDELTLEHGLEKIKTIGDAYMVAGGIPEPSPDHCHRTADLALEMMQLLDTVGEEGFKLRIGLHCGPVIAGVIGKSKFAYDLWGDAVNVASRMESHGMPGRVHVSEAMVALLKDDFEFEARGEVQIKGKGIMSTHFLLRRKTKQA